MRGVKGRMGIFEEKNFHFSARCKRNGQCSRSATPPTLPAVAEKGNWGEEVEDRRGRNRGLKSSFVSAGCKRNGHGLVSVSGG